MPALVSAWPRLAATTTYVPFQQHSRQYEFRVQQGRFRNILLALCRSKCQGVGILLHWTAATCSHMATVAKAMEKP